MSHRPFLSRVALLVLDRGPSLLRLALEGDAPARRILASVGVTPHDLTAIADARAARRRAAEAPPADRVAPGADPLTMDDLSAALAEGQAARARFDAQTAGMRGASLEAQALPMRAEAPVDANDGPVVLGPWRGDDTGRFYDGDQRVRVGGPLSTLPLVAVIDGWFAQGWDQCMGTELLSSGSANDIADARRKADDWARAQGWVLLDAEPGYLRGSKITLGRSSAGQLCSRECDTTPPLRVKTYRYEGWSVWHDGRHLAHGPQTGAEGERLLRAALTALGVDVLDA